MTGILEGKRRAVQRFAFRIAAILLVAPVMLFISPSVSAQSEQTSQSAPQQPLPSQQPGAGAQVHTGSSSGFNADMRVQNLLADHQFLRLQAELNQLPPEQAQLYRGILANRNNDAK